MARGQAHTRVMQARRRDGSMFWERSTGRAVDPGDPARGSVWLLEDITEQKRAEEELQRVLSEQQALANNVVVGIAFVRERKIVRCNRRFEELFGYAGRGDRRLDAAVLLHREEFEASGRSSPSSRPARRPPEQWLRRKDGSGFWCRRTGRAVEPGNLAKGYVWLFEDITERRRADSEVQRMVREQELILDNATVGIAFVRNRMIQRCNRYLEEMVGAAPGALIGKPSSVLFATTRSGPRRAAAPTERPSRAGRTTWSGASSAATARPSWAARAAGASTRAAASRNGSGAWRT